MKYQKQETKNFNLHLINTDKFKTIKFRIVLKHPIIKEEIVLRNILLDVMSYSCLKYPTKKEFIKKLQNLYGASVYAKTYRLGKVNLMNFYLTVLNEKYTEKGMIEESVEFFSELLFNPNISEEGFTDKAFDKSYRENEQSIKNIKDYQGKYSIIRMLELMGNDKEYSFNEYGYLEELSKIDKYKLYDYYKKIISESKVDIYVIGDFDNDNMINIINKYMSFESDKKLDNNYFITHDDYGRTIQEYKETDDSNQSKLVIGYKLKDLNDFELRYVLTLYNIILGSGANSKLFNNIREKHSLCYHISSSINKFDNLLFIKAGINKDNYNLVLDLIDKELQDMENGNFSDEDINRAKQDYLTFLDEIVDSDDGIIETFIAGDMLGIDNIEKRKEKIMTVTKEDIVTVSKKIKLDTIFLLEGVKND